MIGEEAIGELPIGVPAEEAAPPGVTEIPNPLHQLDQQYATIQAHKLNGVLQS